MQQAAQQGGGGGGPAGAGGAGGADAAKQAEEKRQAVEDMKNNILTQVLSQEARARCEGGKERIMMMMGEGLVRIWSAPNAFPPSPRLSGPPQ